MIENAAFLFVIALILGVYFLPTIIASDRSHPNTGVIFTINLFFGCTFVGWICALIWACSAIRPRLTETEKLMCRDIAEMPYTVRRRRGGKP